MRIAGMILAALLLSACFVVPAQQGGAAQPAGGDPYGAPAPGGDPATGGGPAAGGAPAPPPPPAGPTVVSVQLRNACAQTVRLFFGDKPKFGSGKYTTMSSNSVTSYSMNEGDMLWIVDGSDNGLATYTASQGARNVEIGPGCTGFIVR